MRHLFSIAVPLLQPAPMAAAPPRHSPPPPHRSSVASPANRPIHPPPPRPPVRRPHHDGGWRGPVALALATVAALLALTDLALLRGWITDASLADSAERAVRDAEDELDDVRGRIAAIQAAPPATATAATRSAPERSPVVAREAAEPAVGLQPAPPPPDGSVTREPLEDASAAQLQEAADDSPRNPGTPLRERVKIAAVQARVDRLLRAGTEGDVTLVKPIDGDEPLQCTLGRESGFLRIRVVADGPAAWRIESSAGGDDESTRAIAAVAVRARSLVMSILPSARCELLRYLTIDISQSEDRVSIPLGGPYAATFELARIAGQSGAFRPPEEVTLFRDRIAGMRLARACAADGTLVPVIEAQGQRVGQSTAGGGAFQLPLPDGVAPANPFAQPVAALLHFTRDAGQIADGTEFRCTFAGVTVPTVPQAGLDEVVVDSRNRKRLEQMLQARGTEAQARARQASSYEERNRALAAANACGEAMRGVADSATLVRGLVAASFARQPIRVVLRRPDEDGEIVVIEPVTPPPGSLPR